MAHIKVRSPENAPSEKHWAVFKFGYKYEVPTLDYEAFTTEGEWREYLMELYRASPTRSDILATIMMPRAVKVEKRVDVHVE